METRSGRARHSPVRGEGSARLEALVPVLIGAVVAMIAALVASLRGG
jgi:hypothetical protein